MANLVSPGVQVSVTDESVYGPAGSGTVPMLFIATGQDKVDPTGTETDGIAKYTKSANAGKPVLVTSQRELTQYFGEIDFRTVGGAVVQGDETNEYGLLAAYSFLGQSSAAYIVRADVNSVALRPVSAEPKGPEAPIVVTALSLLYEPDSVILGEMAIEPDAIMLSPVALVPAFS